MDQSSRSIIERIFESMLFGSRLAVLVAVVGSLVAAICMFVRGGWAIWRGLPLFR